MSKKGKLPSSQKYPFIAFFFFLCPISGWHLLNLVQLTYVQRGNGNSRVLGDQGPPQVTYVNNGCSPMRVDIYIRLPAHNDVSDDERCFK